MNIFTNVFSIALVSVVCAGMVSDVSNASDDIEKLITKAETIGALPIIVSLKIDVKPEGELSSDEISNQRSAIEAAQSRIIDQLKEANVRLENVKRFGGVIPSMALTTDAEGLRLLLDSPDVIRVAGDVAMPAALSNGT